jgi:hypothetical protein
MAGDDEARPRVGQIQSDHATAACRAAQMSLGCIMAASRAVTVEFPIPIQNLYYLFCYAWNRLEEGGLSMSGE